MTSFLQLLEAVRDRSKLLGNGVGQYDVIWQIFGSFSTRLRKCLGHFEHLFVIKRPLRPLSQSRWKSWADLHPNLRRKQMKNCIICGGYRSPDVCLRGCARVEIRQEPCVLKQFLS
jgi:hypothetical protein